MSALKDNILSTVGGTPLVKLSRVYDCMPVDLYGKMEMFNPGGSIKDRPAQLIITNALKSGELKRGATVVESSSGNMAIGLAQICRYYGLNFIAVVDPKINPHTEKILQTYGACIEKVTAADGDGNYLKARLQRVQELVNDRPHNFWPNQYANEANPAAHFRTMAEIVSSMEEGGPDYLLAATSTCGTIMGCAHYAREHKLDTKIVAVDAVGSVIFGAPPADRLVPGHGAGRPSDLLNRGLIDHVIHINDQECVAGCHRLLNREAILAGGSSGAVISAIEKLHPHIPDGASCALILPDSGERYLDTVYNDKWLHTHFGEIQRFKSTQNGIVQKRHKESISPMIYDTTETG